MVSKQSSHKDAAIELLKFLTSPEIQGVNAATRGYAPTRPALFCFQSADQGCTCRELGESV